MDKFGRLTKNDEWRVGARYLYLKGGGNKISRRVNAPQEATFVGWEQDGRVEMIGWAVLRYADGSKVRHPPKCWRNRWTPVFKAAVIDPMVGQYFHSLDPRTGKVHWQGTIVGNPAPGWYLLQLFEWIAGEPNVRRLVKLDDMKNWLFYPDVAAMRFSYRDGVARAGGQYRDQ